MIRCLHGCVELELTGASLERCLNRWTQAGIPFWDLQRKGELCARCKLYEAHLDRARREAGRAQTTLRVLSCTGLPALLRRLRRRPVLVIGTTLSLVTALFLQSFVWFCVVRGNETVPTAEILHALSEEGVRFGVWGLSLDSEDLKNRMLNRIPELRWLAVNREGGLVTVLTAERKLEEPSEERFDIANVVAIRPGIVREIHVTDGAAVVAPGDSVQTGDLLISGIAEWTTHTQLMSAAGEVYADTMRQIELVRPAQSYKKVYTGRTETVFTIIFQRNRKKISGNSSIFGTKCDRMIERVSWCLPGQYELPVYLEKETLQEYQLVPAEADNTAVGQLLTEEASRLIQEQMVAGTIVRASEQTARKENCVQLRGSYNCLELISTTVPVERYGEDEYDGESH